MATEPLKLEHLANALVLIRRAALLHCAGGAFEPEHMRAIAEFAGRVLDGEAVPEPLSFEEMSARGAEWAKKCGEWAGG